MYDSYFTESVLVVSEEVILLLGLYRWLVFTVAKTITGDTNKRSLGRDIHFVQGIESSLADENKEFPLIMYKIITSGGDDG